MKLQISSNYKLCASHQLQTAVFGTMSAALPNNKNMFYFIYLVFVLFVFVADLVRTVHVNEHTQTRASLQN